MPTRSIGLREAIRALRKEYGAPGAEKILLFTGRQALLAPDSNGLRVLVRLGMILEERSCASTYDAAREIASDLPAKPALFREAHLLLQQHGRTLCRRNAPLCGECPPGRKRVHANRT